MAGLQTGGHMCGIAGVVGPRPAEEDTLLRMAGVIAHRGPDDEGIYVGEGCGLAHRRLSILDLSDAGHQPMSTDDGRFWIVYNGEVYNAADIRRDLLAKGHSFHSTSDTEVILHAYQQWGASCVESFNGMWGFAIWDSRERELFCSRDRFGVKPFYFHLSPSGTFVFGSEIKALLAAGLEAKVNRPYAAHVITTTLLDDGDETFFEGISQLRPAHNMLVRKGIVTQWRYWDIDPDDAQERYHFSDPAEGVRELLTDAVRLRVLASDVQVGSCLSGGLDSSSIVSLASRAIDVPMATFSLQYGESGFDESGYARIVAGEFGCDASYTTPRSEDFFDVLEKMAWFQDEPAAGPGLYSQWHVMQLAAPHVKVLLDGQGGDESMAGYRYHLEGYLQALLGRALAGDMRSLARLRRDLPAVAQSWGLSLPAAAGRAFGSSRLKNAYFAWRGADSGSDVSADIAAEAAENPLQRPTLRSLGDPLNDRLYRDVTRDVIPSLLHYEDRNSMAFSIEARTPFLDYRLIEYALTLPGPEKVRDGQTKWLFRRAMEGVTPAPVLERKDKMGYSTPVDGWFRNGLSAEVRERLLSQTTRDHGVLDVDAIERKLADHQSGRLDLGWQIYRWLSLEQWFRTFIDRRDPSLGPVARL